MPKKVQVAPLRVGMYLQGLEVSWLNHPLWRSKFLIRTEAELQTLRKCDASECWIDPSKGEDIAVPLPEVVRAVSPEAASASPGPGLDAAPDRVAPSVETMDLSAAQSLPSKADFLEELERAAGIRAGAGAAVAALPEQVRQGAPLQIGPRLPVLKEIQLGQPPKRCFGQPHAHQAAPRLRDHARGRGQHADGQPGPGTDAGRTALPARRVGGALAGRGPLPPRAPGRQRLHARADRGRHQRVARMAAICDVHAAVTGNRLYKHGGDPGEAIARMASWKEPLDSAIFSAFVRCMGIVPTGSLVRLQSERLAVVLEQNPGAQSEPVVRVFFCAKTRQRVSPTRLDLAAPGHDDTIISRETAADGPVGTTEAMWSHGYAAKIFGAGADAGRATLSGPVRD